MKQHKTALPARYAWFRETGARPEWARALARAEVWRECEEAEGRLAVEWEQDSDADLSWCEQCCRGVERGASERDEWHCEAHAQEQYCCLLTWEGENGKEFASLCGIDRPDTTYRRLIEAELAHELHVGLAERTERTAWQAGAPD